MMFTILVRRGLLLGAAYGFWLASAALAFPPSFITLPDVTGKASPAIGDLAYLSGHHACSNGMEAGY